MCAAAVRDDKLFNCCNDPKLNPVPQSYVTNCSPQADYCTHLPHYYLKTLCTQVSEAPHVVSPGNEYLLFDLHLLITINVNNSNPSNKSETEKHD